MRQGEKLGSLNWKTDKIYLMDCGDYVDRKIDRAYLDAIENGKFIEKSSK